MMVAPSILACDFSKLREEIASVDRCGVDMIHLDVMDGVFVPNLTFGPILVEAIRRLTTTPLDAHLMIVEPERYVDAFADAGADYIVFHIEATEKP
ncbi:ribulose-phosphate 3-epimerase, partial [candidate division WOR-3 bacterium]